MSFNLYKTAPIAALLLLSACAKQQPQGYTIDGSVVGLSDKVYLTIFEGKMPTRIDSTQVENGMFHFEGLREVPILAAIETPEGSVVRFFLENRPISIQGEKETPEQIQITGSLTHDTYQTYRKQIDSVEEALFADTTLTEQAFDSLDREINKLKMQFVESHLNSVAAAYVLYRELSYGMDHTALTQATQRFSPEVQPSIYVTLVNSMAEALRKTAVGEPYTDFSAPDKEGTPITLSSVVGEGKYVLLDFWASWCPPCRAEAPNLVAAYKTFSPKGFEIYAVSLDKEKTAWLKGIEQLGLAGIQVSELKFWENTGAELYGVRAIPSNILIGPDGKIIARNLMGEELYKKLSELLDAK